MITENEIAEAYNGMVEKEKKLAESMIAEELTEAALIDAQDAEMLDLDLSNPATAAKANAKLRKAAKKELKAFRAASVQKIKDNSAYKIAGMKVDCLNKMVEAGKLASQK